MRQNKFADFAQKVQGGAGAYGYFPNKNKDQVGQLLNKGKRKVKSFAGAAGGAIKNAGNVAGSAIGKAAGFVKKNPVKAAAGLGALAAAGGLGMAGYKALNGNKKKKK